MKTVTLSNGKMVSVSNCDYAYVRRWTWNCVGGKYAQRKHGHRYIYMHHAIARRKSITYWKRIDHENQNTFDNCRRNLRPASRSDNGANRRKQTNNTSGFKGVCWHKAANKWMAQITVKGVNHYIGLFKSRLAAARAYNQAARRYFGTFACLNVA